MPPNNLTPFQLHPAAKQLDGQLQPTSLPSSLTGTSHVLSTPTYATKQLDDTVRTSNPAAQPTALPPSSLTVRGSNTQQEPKSIAVTDHSNCLLLRAPVTPRVRNPRAQTKFAHDLIAHDALPKRTRLYTSDTRTRRSPTLQFATRITRYGKSPWFSDV